MTLNVLGQNTIKGHVVDANGEPVIGASIMVKGTKNGAVSDLDGDYTITDVKDGATLVYSYGSSVKCVDACRVERIALT